MIENIRSKFNVCLVVSVIVNGLLLFILSGYHSSYIILGVRQKHGNVTSIHLKDIRHFSVKSIESLSLQNGISTLNTTFAIISSRNTSSIQTTMFGITGSTNTSSEQTKTFGITGSTKASSEQTKTFGITGSTKTSSNQTTMFGITDSTNTSSEQTTTFGITGSTNTSEQTDVLQPTVMLSNAVITPSTVSKKNTQLYTNTSRPEVEGSTTTSRNVISGTVSPLSNVLVDPTPPLQTLSSRPHYMQVSYLGRTGNQLFSLAMLLSVAHRYGYTPTVPKNLTLWKYFEVPSNCIWHLQMENVKGLGEKKYGMYSPKIETLDLNFNWSFNGYLQSFRYHNYTFLKSQLKFQPSVIDSAKQFLTENNKDNRVTIGVHVRRGDFVTSTIGYEPAPLGFLNHSMEFFRKQFSGNVLFVVASDDIKWCQSNIKPLNNDTIFSNLKTLGEDMALMSLCSNSVVTAGTFSWWCAWFAGGKVVYWKSFPKSGTILEDGMNRTEYYPAEWIGMD